VIRFPNRPTRLFSRARYLGELLYLGELSFDSVTLICHHMAQMDDSQDKSGLEARLCWTASDHAQARASAIWRAYSDIRNIVRPLLNSGASKAAIENAVGSYNEGHGNLLTWEKDLFPILRDEVRKFHARARFSK
jgi:hypothetical protein